jgi:predicted transposase/invertase (TIGR01784 family)
MIQFVDPKSDIAFKKIFGNEQKTEILISFLNAVLRLSGEREIAEIEILNPYQAPRLENLKYTLLDIRARDKRGITFIVEMQVERVAAYKKRFVYYTSQAYVSQIERATDYPRLNQVIFIGILDFHAFSGTSYLTRHVIMDDQACTQEIEDLEFHFIELPKFTKSEAELETMLEKWVYFIKHAPDLSVVPASADTPPLRAAYEVANRFGWSREEMELYDYWSMKEQDERGAIQIAAEEAEHRGIQQGIQQGVQQERITIAHALLQQGTDPSVVASVTGLTPAEVAAIQDEGA